MERGRGMVAEGRPWLDLSSQRWAHRGRCVLLYSHDTYGLGHFRRNSAIAHALRRQDRDARIVMLTGSAFAGGWRLPAGVELVRMPGVVKVGADEYRPVTAKSMSAVRDERAHIIGSTLLRVRPDVFLVDHAPLGMKGELRWALELARHELSRTHVVLGLRDVLDDPFTVRRTWAEQGIYSVLKSFYDQVLVYGCREIFDVTELYALEPEVRRCTVFTGYVAKHYDFEAVTDARVPWTRGRSVGVRRVLVMGGGGGDALELFAAFLRAWPLISRECRAEALLVTGPMMPDEERRQVQSMATGLDRVDLVPSSSHMLSLIAAADVVISMGGYNSVVEAISARRPLVVWPRISPRREQLIRARLLERLGLARVVVPGPDAASELGVAVLEALEGPPPSAEAWRRIDLSGGERVAQLLLEPGRAQVLFR
jgi:predicted glycosyltransferase